MVLNFCKFRKPEESVVFPLLTLTAILNISGVICPFLYNLQANSNTSSTKSAHRCFVFDCSNDYIHFSIYYYHILYFLLIQSGTKNESHIISTQLFSKSQ